MPDNQKNDNMMQQVDSQFRRTYSPNYSWADCISAFSSILGLRGFWPMSIAAASGNIIDHSGLGKTLTYNGNPTLNQSGLIPYMDFDGTGDYLSRADEADMDILGNEGYIAAARQGMTLGGWFRWLYTGSADILIGKTNLGSDQTFVLAKSAGDALSFTVYSGAFGAGAVAVGTGLVTNSVWYFIVARYDPSTEINLFTYDTKETNAAGVPATIFNSVADFTIGAGMAGNLPYAGRAALCFYAASALPDSTIYSLYHISRPLFGM